MYTKAPRKLTPQMQDRLCEWIRKGNRRITAARLSGISDATLDNWMATALIEPDGVCGNFRQAILEAEAAHETSLVARWTEINEEKPDYRGIESLLRHRHGWKGPSEKLEITGANGGPIQVGRPDLEALSDEELETYLKLMEKLAQAQLPSGIRTIEQ